jgi:hypothetical protein
LIAQIDVYQKNGNGNNELKGTLVYETLGKKVKKNKEKEAFETLIEDWIHIFEKDLLRITGNLNSERPKVSNYYPAPIVARQRIFSKISYQYHFNTYSIEANIGFYDPEPGARFRRQTSYLLYVNDVRFESIAFGKRAYQDYLRISPNWILNLELRYCLGLNRWKDFYSYDHTLYDIVNFNIGVKGGILYYPFAKRSFFAGINLSSDLFYIYSMNVFERYGLGFSLGLNF